MSPYMRHQFCAIKFSMSPMFRQGSTSLGSTSCCLRWSCEITVLTSTKIKADTWVMSCITNYNMIYFGVSIFSEYLYVRYPSYTRQSRGSCSKYCHLLRSPYPYVRKSVFGWEGLNPFSRNTPENAEWYLKECHPHCVYQNYSRSMIREMAVKTQLCL